MKTLLVLLATLMLAACIDVDDFGDYWNKATLDPDLKGDWVRLPEPDKPATLEQKTVQEWRFTEKNGAYEVQSHAEGQQDEAPMYPVKTLAVGRYRFVAANPEKGDKTILRYKITGDTIAFMVLNDSAAWSFIDKNYPNPKNIVSGSEGRPALKIKMFDDEVYKILSNIPDMKDYWRVDTRLERMKRKTPN